MIKIQEIQPKTTSHTLFPHVFVEFELSMFQFGSVIFGLDFYETLQ